jgi:hypothetical protein
MSDELNIGMDPVIRAAINERKDRAAAMRDFFEFSLDEIKEKVKDAAEMDDDTLESYRWKAQMEADSCIERIRHQVDECTHHRNIAVLIANEEYRRKKEGDEG